MQEFICELRFKHLRYGGKLNFSCPRAVNKKAVTYHKWCGSSESGPRGSPFSIPSYLYKDLDKHVLRNFSRFRLRAHHLRVESYNWRGGSSICDKCEYGEVQDENHVLFFCIWLLRLDVPLEMMGNHRLLEIMAIKRAGLITCCCLRLCTNLCVHLRCGIRVLLIMRL